MKNKVDGYFPCCGIDWCLHGHDSRPLPAGYVWEKDNAGHSIPIYKDTPQSGVVRVFVNNVEYKQN